MFLTTIARKLRATIFPTSVRLRLHIELNHCQQLIKLTIEWAQSRPNVAIVVLTIGREIAGLDR